MIMQNLWGLLLLLSIPALIIIYIIKQDHKEKDVSSTYLWHLSERFLKTRLPIKRMTSLLAFILQLTILGLLAFSATQPAVALGQISGQIVIIDASASMQTELDGVTRFEAAVAQAKELAQSGTCSSMTVIIASDTPACLVTGGSKGEAINALDQAACGFGGCDVYEAMKLAREAYARMGSAKVTFYTDTQYAEVENVEVVNMHRGEKNVAITSLTHMGGTFEGTVVSYGEDREVTVGLSVDDVLVDTAMISCVDGEPMQLKFTTEKSNFEQATLFFDVEDALKHDNRFTVVGKSSEKVTVLVLGTETLFFEEGFKALGNCDVTVKKHYNASLDGAYDLYLFSGCVSTSDDNFPQNSLTIGFTQLHTDINRPFLGEIRPYGTRSPRGGGNISAFLRDDLTVDPLFKDMETAILDVHINKYVETPFSRGGITVLPPEQQKTSWESICGGISGEVMGLSRVLDNGTRHYLFLFPISSTNLAMTPAFMILLRNASTLALPPSLPKKAYTVGETVEITLKENAKEAAIKQPMKGQAELSGTSPTFVPTEPGLHTLTYELNKQSRKASFFVFIPEAEYETYSADSIIMSKPFERSSRDKLLSSSMLPLVAVLLSSLLIFEWGYHYRGKR
ncbi:MAG: VWA domain-containing protein [Clostridia bacterium]|nr:VWA domain-containing protein [Clostridia bacterium]